LFTRARYSVWLFNTDEFDKLIFGVCRIRCFPCSVINYAYRYVNRLFIYLKKHLGNILSFVILCHAEEEDGHKNCNFIGSVHDFDRQRLSRSNREQSTSQIQCHELNAWLGDKIFQFIPNMEVKIDNVSVTCRCIATGPFLFNPPSINLLWMCL